MRSNYLKATLKAAAWRRPLFSSWEPVCVLRPGEPDCGPCQSTLPDGVDGANVGLHLRRSWTGPATCAALNPTRLRAGLRSSITVPAGQTLRSTSPTILRSARTISRPRW